MKFLVAILLLIAGFVFDKRSIDGLEDVKVLSRICINEAV